MRAAPSPCCAPSVSAPGASGARDATIAGATVVEGARPSPAVSAEIAAEVDALVASGHFVRKPGECAKCRTPGERARPIPFTNCTHEVLCVECYDCVREDCDGDLELAEVLCMGMCSECERAAAGKRAAR